MESEARLHELRNHRMRIHRAAKNRGFARRAQSRPRYMTRRNVYTRFPRTTVVVPGRRDGRRGDSEFHTRAGHHQVRKPHRRHPHRHRVVHHHALRETRIPGPRQAARTGGLLCRDSWLQARKQPEGRPRPRAPGEEAAKEASSAIPSCKRLLLLNEAKTDLNILMGICVGHDALFCRPLRCTRHDVCHEGLPRRQQPVRGAVHGAARYRKKLQKTVEEWRIDNPATS